MKHFLLVLPIALAAACASSESGRLIDKVEVPATATEREARAIVLEYARHWNGVLEEAADEIARRAAEPAIRHDAMRWKVDASGACQSAAMRSDPIAAIVDSWALALQMVDYFEGGPGAERFGPHLEIALAAARRLEVDAATMVRDETTRERVRGRIEAWLADNPVPRSLINRPSAMPVLAAMAGDPKLSAMATLRSAEQRVGDLLERLDFYMEVLPQGARWQMEYVLERYLLSPEEKRGLLEEIGVMADSLRDTAALARDVPGLMATERERIGELVNEQRELALTRLEGERKAILQAVSDERAALAETVATEREAVFAGLRERQDEAFASVAAEREALLAAVDEQRRATLAEVERLTRLAVAESGGEGRGAIDHFFGRAAVAGGGFVALLFVAGLVFVRLVRRR